MGQVIPINQSATAPQQVNPQSLQAVIDALQRIPPRVEPSKKMQDAALKYGGQWMRTSRQYIMEYEDQIQRLTDIVDGVRKLSEWHSRISRADSSDITAATQSESKTGAWRAEMVINPTYIVDSWADRAFNEIFGRTNYLSVYPAETSDASIPNVEDQSFSTARKMEAHLLDKLRQGEFDIRNLEALRSCGKLGTVFGKVYWYYRDVPKFAWGKDPFSGELKINRSMRRIGDYPCLQIIPLPLMLPDWSATHYNVQQWSGIGHRTILSYAAALEMFDAGILHLNRSEFVNLFSKTGAMENEGQGTVFDPKAANLTTEEIPRLMLWEWHGLLPFGGRQVECCMIIATQADQNDSPEGGLLVKLSEGPILWSGERPFVAAQYKPSSRPLGDGALQPNLDLIYYVSSMICQLIDNARLTTNAIVKVKKGSPMHKKLLKKKEMSLLGAGRVWEFDEKPDEIDIVKIEFTAGQTMNQLIQWMNQELSVRTNQNDQTQGQTTPRVTATASFQAGMQADIPFSIRTKLFARTFVEKAGSMALDLIQQMELSDQTVRLPDSMGMMQPQMLTSDEIMTGIYRVVCSMLAQDQTKDIKAQNMEQFLPNLVNAIPILNQHGADFNVVEYLKKIMEYRDFENPDRVITMLPPQPQAPPMQGMGQPGAQPGMSPTPSPGPAGGPLGPLPSDPNQFMNSLQQTMNGPGAPQQVANA